MSKAFATQPIGAMILSLRTEAKVTQTQLAQAAQMDQSRVSRIEKGEIAPAKEDLDRLLEALAELGSSRAKPYSEYLGRDWVQIEPPEFDNPQLSILELAEETLGRVEKFLSDDARPWPLRRQLQARQKSIRETAAFLVNTSHQIAFIGEVGVGKSTAISFLYGLLEPASEGKRLERVVLEAGGGHTTLCEVNIRRAPAYGIRVEPMPDNELRSLMADFCASTWMRRPGHEVAKGEKVGVSEEVQRALRNMSGLTVKREKGSDGRPIYRDQALELALVCQSEEEFRARFVELIKLDQRTRREIWIEEGGSKSAMQQLRGLFRDVNNGRLADVPMPSSIDLLISGFGAELDGLSVSVVDTKGMDEITVRADLDTRLKDPRTHVVLCSTFNQAPSTSVQLLLDHLHEAHGIEIGTGKVSILALPRPGEALGVKDDTGEPPTDDKEGYLLKRDQILRQLGSGDTAFAKVPVFFFNAHDDAPDPVRADLYGQIRTLRKHSERRLQDECAAVEEVLHNHEHHAFNAAVQEVAKRLGHFLNAHRNVGARVRPVHQEIIDALNGTRYASTVWAMTRRGGEYYNFSVTHHLGSGCAKDALLRSHQWFERLQGELETMKQDLALQPAERTIGQIEASAGTWRRTFAEAVRIAAIEVYREEIEEAADLWVGCSGEWGQGAGFRDRVVRRLRQWFESKTDLNDELERIISTIWENEVVDQLERLTNESWSQESEPDNVVKMRKKNG